MFVGFNVGTDNDNGTEPDEHNYISYLTFPISNLFVNTSIRIYKVYFLPSPDLIQSLSSLHFFVYCLCSIINLFYSEHLSFDFPSQLLPKFPRKNLLPRPPPTILLSTIRCVLFFV